MLRRQITGAEPLTDEQRLELSRGIRKIDAALARLSLHLGGQHVSVEKSDRALRAIEGELDNLISKHINTVKSFRRWQPVKVGTHHPDIQASRCRPLDLRLPPRESLCCKARR